MAYVQERRVTFGQLMSGTAAELGAIARPIGIYLAVFLGLAIGEAAVQGASGIFGLTGFVAYWAGQHWLYRCALGRSGWPTADDIGPIFMLFAMALLIAITMYIGAIFFVVPGIILGAKWVMSPTFLVAERRNLIEAISDAWHASSGNTAQLAFAFTALVIMWIVVFSMASALIRQLVPGAVDNLLSNLAIHGLPIVLLGLSVTAWRHLGDGAETLADVFE